MDRPIVHALTDAASEALFTGVRGREILGSPGRSESQQLVSDSCNKRSIRGVAKGQKCLCPTRIGLGTGPRGGACYRELRRITLFLGTLVNRGKKRARASCSGPYGSNPTFLHCLLTDPSTAPLPVACASPH